MSRFLFPTSIHLASHGCLLGNSSILRTAVCGPACTVVWEGRRGDSPPYPDSCRATAFGFHLVDDTETVEYGAIASACSVRARPRCVRRFPLRTLMLTREK